MGIGPASSRNLTIAFIFGMLWAIGGLLFTIVERGVIGDMEVYPSTGVAYEFTNNLVAIPLATFIGGVILIGFDLVFLNKRLRRRSFPAIIAIKSVVFFGITLVTTLAAGMVATSITLQKSPLSSEVLTSLLGFAGNFAFWSILIYAGFLSTLYLFIIEVSNSLGYKVFQNFFTGKYHRPKVEDRIFMFLDLKGSTRIAEKLGHVRYYEFLNRFIEDVNTAVLKSWGTIYQYVGDEVVAHWPRTKAKDSIYCYFLIRQTIEKNRAEYETRFSEIPEYRVGIHGGSVSIGEIGTQKKDILYIGDVLNATSRIQGLCKDFSVDILISSQVSVDLDPDAVNLYDFRDMGTCELRGKEEQVQLFTLTPRD